MSANLNSALDNNALPPTAFVSYSWDSERHKAWTKDLAKRLRSDGIDAKLDQWETVPGDQLPHFMERAIRDNRYVLIVCTPNYKRRSDNREGGVGYEGDIMTGEVLTTQNRRKFISILRDGDRTAAIPTWLAGKYDIDLRGDSYSEEQYADLLCTLFDTREKAPPIGRPIRQIKPLRRDAREVHQDVIEPSEELEPIRIVGVVVDEIGEPRNDGTRGSALYAIPFKLSRAPSQEWSDLFIQIWAHPPRCSLRHRPRSVRVSGDLIVLTQTTIDEVREVHRDTLKLVVEETNRQFATLLQQRRREKEQEEQRRQQHKQDVRRIAGEIDFD